MEEDVDPPEEAQMGMMLDDETRIVDKLLKQCLEDRVFAGSGGFRETICGTIFVSLVRHMYDRETKRHPDTWRYRIDGARWRMLGTVRYTHYDAPGKVLEISPIIEIIGHEFFGKDMVLLKMEM